MGRFATGVAAAFTDADNLPPSQSLPSVSVIDALLPRCLSNLTTKVTVKDAPKPLDLGIGRKTYVTYYDIKKGSNGSKSFVAHRSDVGKAKKDDSKKNSNGNGDKETNQNKAQDKTGGGDGKGDTIEWTAAEDAKLKELKAQNKSWKEIVEEMGHNKSQLQARFKELNKPENGDKPNDNKPNPKSNNNDNNAKQSTGKKDNKTKEKSGKAQTGKPKPTKPAAAEEGEARFTMAEWTALHEDDVFSLSELQVLSELVLRDQDQTWDRVASAFFDKTGRRVHPSDIRDKFEQMAGMG